MHHWLQLATRNWWARPLRAGAVVLAVALGVATVIAVVSVYESVEYAINDQVVNNWVGRSHLNIQTPLGHWGNLEPRFVDDVRRQANVARVAVRFNTPMRVLMPEGVVDVPQNRYRHDGRLIEINAIGVEPEHEYEFRQLRDLEGRALQPADTGVVVVDRQLARDLRLDIGDVIGVEPFMGDPAQEFRIVGTYAAARIAQFQRPSLYFPIADVNALRQTQNAISVIDAIVHDESPAALEATAEALRGLIRGYRWNYEVTTATAKLNQLRAAQQITRLVLVLFSAIALLTSFFIIATTMSMGMMERIRLLGTLRCVGVTRGQLALLVLAEVMPLGVAGIVLGIPTGIGLTHLGVAFVPHVDRYVQTVVFGTWGMSVAALGGLLTTLAAAGAVVIQAIGVSPLRATTPEARAPRRSTVAWAAGLAAALLAVHLAMIAHVSPLGWTQPLVALAGMGCVYAAYILLAPAAVLLLGSAALFVIAPLLGIRRKLVRDQVGRAPWRSAGVCWMLMVGLSLIVFFGIRGESIVHAWDFPSKMAGTFVWAERPFSARLVDDVRRLPGVVAVTPINDVMCSVRSREQSILNMFKSKSVFVGGDPDTFLEMSQLEFLEGNEASAREKLASGGYILLPAEAAHAFGYGLGDKVPVTIGASTHELEVAGVVRSPSMDIAVSFFQADTYMMIAAASAVLGTLDDLARHFHIHDHTMYLMDLDPGESAAPSLFSQSARPQLNLVQFASLAIECSRLIPAEGKTIERHLPALRDMVAGTGKNPGTAVRAELARYVDALSQAAQNWEDVTPTERWEIFRDGLILGAVRKTINRPDAMTGSIRRLKQRIDQDIRTATLVISAMPLMSLIVASIGVANLMMVNVATRSRQIAILRAVGATQSQIARLVIIEAMVLGAIGCCVGVLLGMHLAHADGLVWKSLIGIEMPWAVPWRRVLGAVALTWLICVLSGIGPAMRAARRNVIDAMQAS